MATATTTVETMLSAIGGAELTDFIFGVSAASLLCIYPLFILGWILLDSCRAAQRGKAEVERSSAGGATASKSVGEDKCSADKPAKPSSQADTQAALLGNIWASGLLGSLSCLRGCIFFIVSTLRLIVYAALLLPWFLQVAYAYVTHPLLRRGIRYGPNSRNYLDVYLSKEALANIERKSSEKVPVVITVMGGAWIIGHRAWNTHMGLRLSEAGNIVIAVDYRNYPFATLPEMLKDIELALDWAFANVDAFGGDVENMALIGQSAGAHLEALLLVERSLAEARRAAGKDTAPVSASAAAAPPSDKSALGGAAPAGEVAHPPGTLCSARGVWSVSDFKGWVGVSGVYDLVGLDEHMKKLGVASWIPGLCPGGDMRRFSPTQLLLESAAWCSSPSLAADAIARLPPTTLFHGEADTSVPISSIKGLASALRTRGARSLRTDIRPGIAHATPVVEDPFRGGDIQAELIVPFLGPEAERRLKALPPPWPQPPRSIVNLAEYLMPF